MMSWPNMFRMTLGIDGNLRNVYDDDEAKDLRIL